MGDINNYVTVTITKNAVGITRLGFGTLLALSPNAPFGNRVKSYGSDADVAVDYTNTRSPERRISSAVFGQAIAPKRLKFGRRGNKSTMINQVSVVTVKNLYTYTLAVTGDSFDRTTVTFTSDGTATDAEIAAGLVIALNAVAGKNYTASGAASPVSITGNAAGNWFTIELLASTSAGAGNPADDLKVAMTHADPGITADITAIAAEDSDFYMTYNVSNSTAEATALAVWTEANKRLFMADVSQTDSINVVVGAGTDFLKTANTTAFSRTFGFWHHRLDQMPGAALAARCLVFSAGTEAWHDKTLALVDPTPWLTATHRTNLINRKANGYELIAGIGVTFQGTCADGSYIDITRLLDAFSDDCQKRIFQTKVNNAKVGYDDDGIRLIANDFRGSINSFAGPGQGFNADTIVVQVPLSADIPAGGADRLARVLNGIKGFVQATGAIAQVNVAINVVA